MNDPHDADPFLYACSNDEYAHMLGNKHPAAMGVEGSVGWAEVWDTVSRLPASIASIQLLTRPVVYQLGPLAARVMQGESISAWDQHFPVYRNGFLEENYHSWSYLPIRNAEGHIVGYEVRDGRAEFLEVKR